MELQLTLEDALELALHRAVRGEIAPDVKAITADLSVVPIRLAVYHYGVRPTGEAFEETVEAEMEECLPKGVPKSLARISCSFHDGDKYEVFF